MKKLFFLLAFGLFTVGMANAQSCSKSANKSCCATKISKAAAADPTIEKRTADDGAVSYVRREADAQGNVQFVSVKYDEGSNAFVNVAPASATDNSGMVKKSCSASEKKACAGGEKKACCMKSASGEKASCNKAEAAPAQNQ